MNPFAYELSGPLAITVARVLLHFLWQGTLLAAGLAIALRLTRNASARDRHALACGTLALMAAAPVVTFLALTSTSEVFEPLTAVSATPMPGVPSTPTEQIPPVIRRNWLPWITWGWLIGVGILGIRLLGGWYQVRRLATRLSTPVPVPWQERCGILAQRLGIQHPVRLLESARVQGPMVIGWLRPVILLPLGFLQSLPGAQIDALLLHELAHIRGHDYLVNLLQRIAETLLFYHPAVWWVSEQIRREREFRCDDRVREAQGDGHSLASALVTLAERVHDSNIWHLAATDGSMGHRVKRLLSGEPTASPHPRRLGRWILGAGLGMLLMGAAVVAVPILRAPQLYVATARVQMVFQPLNPNPSSGGNAQAPYDPYYLATFLESLRSQKVLRHLSVTCGLMSRWGLSQDDCIERLRTRTRIRQYRGTSIFEVQAADSTPELAKDLADALARQCGIVSRSGPAEEERAELDHQIRRLSEMINESLEGLQEKREERNKALLKRRVELETRIHTNGAVVRQLREKSRGPKFPNLEANLARRLEGLIADSSVAEQQRARWINDFGPEHPEVKRLDGVIGKLELERMEAVDGLVSSLSTQISEDQAEVKRITTLTSPGSSDQQKENPTDGPALLMKIRKDILENLATETIRQKALLDLGLEPSKVKPTVTFFDSARVPVRKTRWRPE